MPQRADLPASRLENGVDFPQLNAAARMSDAELEALDISLITQFVYEWGGYRYSNLGAAISAATRGTKANLKSTSETEGKS